MSDNYVEIQLNNGFKTIIDSEDFEKVSKFRWTAMANKKEKSCNVYARGGGVYICEKTGKKRDMFLHRFLLNAPKNRLVDHINGNSLDNRKSNLRLANHSQNLCNMRPKPGKKYARVVHVKLKNRTVYQVFTTKNSKKTYNGQFESEHIAALYADYFAIQRDREFAYLNFEKDIVLYFEKLLAVEKAARHIDWMSKQRQMTALHDALGELDEARRG
jgi:shikimate kinase